MMNLLPTLEKKALVREYWWRFTHVVALVLLAAVSVASILLLPSFVYLAFERDSLDVQLSALRAQNALFLKDTSAQVELAETARQLELTRPVSTTSPLPSSSILAAVGLMGHAILLESIGYSKVDRPQAGKETAMMVIRGSARDRNELLRFIHVLEGEPRFIRVDSPLTNLIKDKDILFTLQVAVR